MCSKRLNNSINCFLFKYIILNAKTLSRKSEGKLNDYDYKRRIRKNWKNYFGLCF
jgi:hypothetical protein